MPIPKLAWGAASRLVWGSGLALLVLGGAFLGLGLVRPCTPAPAIEAMPSFEQELYLRVVARWTEGEDCLDVTIFSNLPEGTAFQLEVQARPTRDTRRTPLNRLVHPHGHESLLARGPRTEALRVFCDAAAQYKRKRHLRNGLLLRAVVSSFAPSDLFRPGVDPEAQQALRIGRKGALLRGPLVRRDPDVGTSETFVLEALP